MQFGSYTIALYSTLVLAFWQCSAAQPYRGSYRDAKCSDPQTGRQLFIGDAFTRPGQCVRVQCLGNLHLWEDKCQVPELKGSCNPIPIANEYLDYPKCCPDYQCKTFKTDDFGETEETRTYDHYGRLRKTDITQVLMVTDPLNRLPGSGLKTQFEI